MFNALSKLEICTYFIGENDFILFLVYYICYGAGLSESKGTPARTAPRKHRDGPNLDRKGPSEPRGAGKFLQKKDTPTRGTQLDRKGRKIGHLAVAPPLLNPQLGASGDTKGAGGHTLWEGCPPGLRGPGPAKPHHCIKKTKNRGVPNWALTCSALGPTHIPIVSRFFPFLVWKIFSISIGAGIGDWSLLTLFGPFSCFLIPRVIRSKDWLKKARMYWKSNDFGAPFPAYKRGCGAFPT